MLSAVVSTSAGFVASQPVSLFLWPCLHSHRTVLVPAHCTFTAASGRCFETQSIACGVSWHPQNNAPTSSHFTPRHPPLYSTLTLNRMSPCPLMHDVSLEFPHSMPQSPFSFKNHNVFLLCPFVRKCDSLTAVHGAEAPQSVLHSGALLPAWRGARSRGTDGEAAGPADCCWAGSQSRVQWCVEFAC